MAVKKTKTEVQFYATASFRATISHPLKAKTFEDALVEAKALKPYNFISDDGIEIQDYDSPDLESIYKI